MNDQNSTGTEQSVESGVIRPQRFRLARRFALELTIIILGVSAGVAFANWRGVPDRLAQMPAFLAQTVDVVGEAVSQAITPDDDGEKIVVIELQPEKNTAPAPDIAPNPVPVQSETIPESVGAPQGDEQGAEQVMTPPADTLPAPTSENNSPVPPPPGSTYRLTIQRSGPGSGIVQSDDLKIVCGPDCTEDYPKNSSLLLKAYSETGSAFAGWSMPCSGTGVCGIALTGDTTISVMFNSISIPVIGTEDDGSEDPGIGGTGKVLVSEIMAGSDGNADNEFIELYNPTDSPISLSGWMIKKRTSNGTESVLVSSLRFSGRAIPARGYFLITHEGLYQGTTPADMSWPSTYTIAYSDNSILLYDGTQRVVENVSWAVIPVGQSYARTSWDGNAFVAGAPTPRNSSQ